MKYLEDKNQFFNKKSFCRKYGIDNYTINDDGSIDVDGDVNLYNESFSKLPLKFRNISVGKPTVTEVKGYKCI